MSIFNDVKYSEEDKAWVTYGRDGKILRQTPAAPLTRELHGHPGGSRPAVDLECDTRAAFGEVGAGARRQMQGVQIGLWLVVGALGLGMVAGLVAIVIHHY